MYDGHSLFHLPRYGGELLAMTARDFFELVARMRRSQKEYFKNRSRLYLRESKELEQKVDAEIERVEKMICHPQVKQDKEKQNVIYTQDLPLFGA